MPAIRPGFQALFQGVSLCALAPRAIKSPTARGWAGEGCLTMTYFRTGAPYYHRRAAVSRSCSGWEGVGPAGCGRQALSEESEDRTQQDSRGMPRGSGC